jgi:hypothetical protein
VAVDTLHELLQSDDRREIVLSMIILGMIQEKYDREPKDNPSIEKTLTNVHNVFLKYDDDVINSAHYIYKMKHCETLNADDQASLDAEQIKVLKSIALGWE